VAHYTGTGEPRADWYAVWKSWCARERTQFGGRPGLARSRPAPIVQEPDVTQPPAYERNVYVPRAERERLAAAAAAQAGDTVAAIAS
jgi:hypothetical protein